MRRGRHLAEDIDRLAEAAFLVGFRTDFLRHPLHLFPEAFFKEGFRHLLAAFEPGAEQVRGDRARLEQALQNLAGNAMRYAPPGTTIRLGARRADGTIVMSVEDEGPGIPPEEIPHLFSPFARLKRDVARTLPGSGLGLYISKRLIEAMGGKIWVESSGKPGEGSSFFLLLPAAAPMLQA